MRVPYTRVSPLGTRSLLPLLFSHRFYAFCLLLLLASLVYFSLTSDQSDEGDVNRSTRPRFSLDEMRGFALRKSLSTDYKPGYYSSAVTSFERMVADTESRFDIAAHDVLVFVHIQKTAGTSFEKFLVRHLAIERPCECTQTRKRCSCKRAGSNNETWLFSRYSTGWVCGLHADFTELAVSACVDTVLDKKEGSHHRRRYFYTSFLRDPVTRFISEFRHVSRGATWMASRHMCNGRPPTPEELPLCYDPRQGWEGVTMDEFLACPYNLAFNRMTRMLADLTLVDCYDTTKKERYRRDAILLESAKANLRGLSFYGIKERMDDSQWIFQRLFGMQFTRSLSDWSKSKSNDTVISEDTIQRIKQANHLDIELYDYAVKLFDQRLERMKRDGVPPTQPTFAPAQSQAAPKNEVEKEEEEEEEEPYSDEEEDRYRRRR